MKKFIYFLITIWIILSVSFIGCQKDDIESDIEKVPSIENIVDTSDSTQKVSPRTGTADILFFKSSLTTDNYLISAVRSYKIFNKAKIKQIQFTATTQPLINVSGTLMRHYRITITFNDLTNDTFNAYSKSAATSFTYIPNGINLLSDSHSAKYLEITQIAGSNGYTYNFWRDVTISPKTWIIKKDGDLTLATKSIEPIDKNSNLFIPTHVH